MRQTAPAAKPGAVGPSPAAAPWTDIHRDQETEPGGGSEAAVLSDYQENGAGRPRSATRVPWAPAGHSHVLTGSGILPSPGTPWETCP